MSNIDLNEIEILNFILAEYAEEHLSPSTFIWYKTVVAEHLKMNALNKIESGNYKDVFSIQNLKKISRNSNMVRPALIKFLDALYNEGVLGSQIDFLKSKNNIEEVFSRSLSQEEREVTFLSPQELKALFGNRISYRTEEEEKLVPLLCAFSFFCMLKQGEINKLVISDIDIEKKRVRIRRNQEDKHNLVSWLNFENTTYKSLLSYLEYRKNLNTSSDYLMVDKNGNPLNNQKVNALFNSLRRTENKLILNDVNISQELLIRSMILYILTNTNGNGIYQLLLIHEPSNSQFQHAFNEYISIQRLENNQEAIDSFTISDIVPKKRNKPHTNSKDNYTMGSYSEKNDISEVDLNMYDEEHVNYKNLEENKITIQRMVRNSKVVSTLKEKYSHECQLCGFRIRKSNSEYSSEGHHIQPYNKKHRGDDNSSNIIILCPNCHTQFDDLYFAIHPVTELVYCILGEEDDYHLSTLKMSEGHVLGKKYLDYTWGIFEEKQKRL
ncbi:HNH endonuclease [Paenisporosarcina sp. NPDC076898]|uniref:HNH endonuclease n=1 Tax=unclassified Paenisporosarcina TaxID=2642018 RepID=UPI003D01434D